MTSFAISGMTCNGCLSKVRSALERLSPEVRVTLDPPRAVFPDAAPPAEAVSAALAAAGSYGATLESRLAAAPAPSIAEGTDKRSWLATYYPLLLIIGYIAIGSLAPALAGGSFDGYAWMNGFMAGFFLVFSFFKLLDLRGFASSYAGYDLLASRWPAYGFLYPFIELALGLAYLFSVVPLATNLATLLVMAFGSLGVIAALSQRRAIRCACLGTVLNLPMSTVTLVEDLAMAAMALAMLVHLA